jgi:hypothetical protein
MDELLIVRILQRVGYLLCVGDDACQRNEAASWMALPQSPIGGIVEYKKGDFIHDTEIQHAHNMRMHQTGEGARLPKKPLKIIAFYSGLEHLESNRRIEIHMLREVDIGKAAATDETRDAIISQLLSNVVCHARSPLFVNETR